MRLKRTRSKRSDSVVEKQEESKTELEHSPIDEDADEESKNDFDSQDLSLRGSIQNTSGGRKSFVQGFTHR
jgi:hypothetical protein